jgi:hypothetical protein
MRRALLLAAPMLVTSVAAGPFARASGDEVAAAQVLFEEGRRRMAEHDYAGACPKLEESQHLAPGAGTEFNLADCWENVDRLASAWAAFLDVADLTHRRGEPERERAARDRAASLEPRLGRITIDVPPAQRIPELGVQRDGQDVREALWGVSVPVDAGEHRVEARAPGRRPWSMIVRAVDGQTIGVSIPDLPASPASVEFAPLEHPATESAAPAAPPPAPVAPWLALGGSVVLAGVGVLGLVEYDHNVGSYNSNGACPSISAANRPASCQGFVDAANTWKTVAIVDFVASGLALAGAATLWITAPHQPRAAAIRCHLGIASMGCAGVF